MKILKPAGNAKARQTVNKSVPLTLCLFVHVYCKISRQDFFAHWCRWSVNEPVSYKANKADRHCRCCWTGNNVLRNPFNSFPSRPVFLKLAYLPSTSEFEKRVNAALWKKPPSIPVWIVTPSLSDKKKLFKQKNELFMCYHLFIKLNYAKLDATIL